MFRLILGELLRLAAVYQTTLLLNAIHKKLRIAGSALISSLNGGRWDPENESTRIVIRQKGTQKKM